ncbi:MAG: C39 family peptidase [Slackia sp.]|nr:C39 family peptidase [Slackia sp.]
MTARRNDEFDIYEDEREAARRRLERRRAAAAAASGAPSGSRRSPSSSSQARSSRSRARADERIDPLAHSLVGAPASVLDGGIHIPRPLIILAGVALLAIIFVGIGAIERSCSAQQDEPGAIQVDAPAQPEPEPVEADFTQLPASLGTEYVEALQAKADDARIDDIVNDSSGYIDTFGEEAAVNLLELAAEDDAALDFVAGLLDAYPSSESVSFEDEVSRGTVPLLYQWDTRWAYRDYCAGPIGTTGCCPTSLSMVYMGLTGETDKTPADMAAIAAENGYAEDGQGTYATFLTDMAAQFGLQCEKFTPSTQNLLTYLQSGYVVICNVGPGDFTDAGHFFVATGLADDGTVTINDPYSSVNSAMTWDADRIANQSIGMYAFRA